MLSLCIPESQHGAQVHYLTQAEEKTPPVPILMFLAPSTLVTLAPMMAIAHARLLTCSIMRMCTQTRPHRSFQGPSVLPSSSPLFSELAWWVLDHTAGAQYSSLKLNLGREEEGSKEGRKMGLPVVNKPNATWKRAHSCRKYRSLNKNDRLC